jgi:hypothetical protein
LLVLLLKGFKFTDEEAKEKRKLEMATYGIDLGSSSSESEGEGEEQQQEEGGEEGEGDGVVLIGGKKKNLEGLTAEEMIQMIDEDPIKKIELSQDLLRIAGIVPRELSVEDAARQQAVRAEAAVGGGLKVTTKRNNNSNKMLTLCLKRAAEVAKALALKGTMAVAAGGPGEDDEMNTKVLNRCCCVCIIMLCFVFVSLCCVCVCIIMLYVSLCYRVVFCVCF